MNFIHLYAFFSVAKAGSVSAGADIMKVSQPAVTREIKELEKRVGSQLFDRLPRGVVLTEAGSLLMRYATQIFGLADSAELELRELAGLSAGHLDLGASATVGVYLVPQFLAEFHTRNPNVRVGLSVSNSRAVQSAVCMSEIGLGFIEGPFDATKLDSLSLGHDEIIAVTNKNPGSISEQILPVDLVAGRTILRERGSGIREAVDDAYARLGLSIEPIVSVSNTEAIKRLLRSTPGSISFLSRMSVVDELSAGVLEEVGLQHLKIERRLNLIWLKGRSLSRGATLFKALVASASKPHLWQLDPAASQANG